MPQKISPDIVRVCNICGKQFHPRARRQFSCNEERTKVCVICGKEFTIVCNTTNAKKQTCSVSCNAKLVKLSREKSAKEQVRVCPACGKEFHPVDHRQVYCDSPHFRVCVVCGKEFEYDPRKERIDDPVKTCSKECRYTLSISTRDQEAANSALKESLMQK